MSSSPSPPNASQEPPGTLVPVVAAWLVPGAGHLLLKRPWPALFVAAAILPLFVFGMWLTGWENVSWERHPYYFALQAPAGVIAFAGELLARGIVPDRLMPHASEGTLFGGVAGLLNLMAIADVWARTRRGDPVEKDAHPAGTASAGDGEAPGA